MKLYYFNRSGPQKTKPPLYTVGWIRHTYPFTLTLFMTLLLSSTLYASPLKPFAIALTPAVNKPLLPTKPKKHLSMFLTRAFALHATHKKTALYPTTRTQVFLDPVLGNHAHYKLNDTWRAIVAADIPHIANKAPTNHNINGMIGYQPQNSFNNIILYAGYRLLSPDQGGHVILKTAAWEMKPFGPVAGITIDL